MKILLFLEINKILIMIYGAFLIYYENASDHSARYCIGCSLIQHLYSNFKFAFKKNTLRDDLAYSSIFFILCKPKEYI